MRRLAFAAVCGTLLLAACSDQTPTEPTVPPPTPPAENIGSCGATPFPLLGTNGIAQQINNIYPGTSKTQVQLRTAALLQATAIKLLWDTCHPDAARNVAFAFIDWLNKHTPAGKETQVQNLILAILKGIGQVTDSSGNPGDFGVGFFDPNNPNKTLITTVNHHALIQLDPGSFLVPTEIVISRKAGDPNLTDFDGNQFPPTYDYNAINSTNTHVLQPGKTANIAFCLVIIGGPSTPGNGYPDPANLRIGHNPVVGAPGFPFEILEPFDLEGTPLRNSLTCPGIDDVIGSAGGGLQNFANAALRTAGSYLLPPPLWAAALGTLPPPPPRTGKAGSLSPFKPVEVITNSLSFTEDPTTNNTSTGNYFKGVPLDTCGDGCFPAVEVQNGSGTPVGAGTNVTVSLIQTQGTGGVLGGTLTKPINSFSSGPPFPLGQAEFDDLTISAPGTYKLKFTAPGAAPITSAEFKVYTMAFTVQPTAASPDNTVSELAFLGQAVTGFDNPVVQVSIVDFANAVVTTANDRVDMAVTTGSLNGQTSVDANSGVANFTEINSSPIFQAGLKVGVEADELNVSLQASASYFGTNPVQATSTTFNVTNAP